MLLLNLPNKLYGVSLSNELTSVYCKPPKTYQL